jgi:hypothetical protein
MQMHENEQESGVASVRDQPMHPDETWDFQAFA